MSAAFVYEESGTDDARLVLRVIREATDRGAVALNYISAVGLLRDEQGKVTGILAEDAENGEPVVVRVRIVVNATGAWADNLRRHIEAPARLRPMRGSHLVIPGWRLRLGQVASFFHHENGRPIYCVPWQGVVLVGTTDVDQELLEESGEPRPSAEEIHFLLGGLQARFPTLNLTLQDVQAVFAGLRPVADVHTSDPTKASREHVILYESGLFTVARRFSVKPGITCLWQINSREPKFDEWIRSDMEYIDNWSLALDLKILARTIPAVISGHGAH